MTSSMSSASLFQGLVSTVLPQKLMETSYSMARRLSSIQMELSPCTWNSFVAVAKDGYHPDEVKGAPVTHVASATSVASHREMEEEELIDGVINGANKQTRPVRLRFKWQCVPRNQDARDDDSVETVYSEQTVNNAEFNDLYSRHNPASDPLRVVPPGGDDAVQELLSSS
jgi:hypothetical protein